MSLLYYVSTDWCCVIWNGNQNQYHYLFFLFPLLKMVRGLHSVLCGALKSMTSVGSAEQKRWGVVVVVGGVCFISIQFTQVLSVAAKMLLILLL